MDSAGNTGSHTYTLTINAALTLGSLSNTAWTVNRAGYSGTIAVIAGTPAYSNLTATGLPAGLSASLSGSTITLSGTPTATGSFSVNVHVTDAAGAVASSTFALTINAIPTLGSLTPTQWTVSQPGYNGTIAVSGGTGSLYLSAGNMVPGLYAVLSGTTITFGGTPTTAGTYSNVQLTVQDSTGASSTGTYTITINAAPTLGSLSTTAWTVNQVRLQRHHRDHGRHPCVQQPDGHRPAGGPECDPERHHHHHQRHADRHRQLQQRQRQRQGRERLQCQPHLQHYHQPRPDTGNIVPDAVDGEPDRLQRHHRRHGRHRRVQQFDLLRPADRPVRDAERSPPLPSAAHRLPPAPSATPRSAVKDATGATASHTYSMTINALPTLGTLSITAWTVNQSGYTGIIGISGRHQPLQQFDRDRSAGGPQCRGERLLDHDHRSPDRDRHVQQHQRQRQGRRRCRHQRHVLHDHQSGAVAGRDNAVDVDRDPSQASPAQSRSAAELDR